MLPSASKNAVSEKVNRSKSDFADVAKRSNDALVQLKYLVQRGNDIISALDVLNALETVSKDSIQLLALIEEANRLQPELDALVQAGHNVLGSKFF